MDYQYENLGDDRFQEFCTTLLCQEFPNVQAFPVGQPDGGRDSIAYSFQPSKKEFVVFQVKYVKNPHKEQSPHSWLIKKLEEEAPKIAKLIPKGAKSYHFITNVNSTSHLDSGSIDKVNEIFEKYIDIPAVCWWREDLSRRLEMDPMIKWSYPQILDGQSLLNSILFENISESRQKREDAVTAYLADQYEIDNKVKFRQIDLESDLLNLFTDVPMKIKDDTFRKSKSAINKFLTYSRIFEKEENNYENYFSDEIVTVEAAAFFLNPTVQEKFQKVVLEGGPGQGKSTVSQYICQVHRAILLNKSALGKLPENIKNTTVRLPFKVDLRHLASWVDRKNPYKETLNDEIFKSIYSKSLESFLTGHICSHSQQTSFRVEDLMAIAKRSPLLIVFDGFDEVADSEIRGQIIELIDKGLNRLSEISLSIQVIITSRPAAFSSYLSFDSGEYTHFELTSIDKKTIDNYVGNWVKASKLNSRETKEIRKLVDEKLSLPHLRDLAKSPMQLVIFLSLLRTRGESLPNKRTALYDSYVLLFFNRESEKSEFIRSHRDVIIDIHGYLAWVLHSEAELFNNNGVIELEKLKEKINFYLSNEGHDTSITDQLFKAVQERVCALVSRVQGTFEFEVQPLREYFCAKYLYETAPYSPAGSEKRGTKPDRFNAISGNPYWQNVVRFFAGCFDRGELPMLIDSLKILEEDDALKYTNYPQMLTSNLLSDYVFTQYPRYLKDAIEIIVSSINIGNLIGQGRMSGANEAIYIPESCGNEELLAECFDQLAAIPPIDYAYDLIGLINNNSSSRKTIEIWSSKIKKKEVTDIVAWINFAKLLNIVHLLNEEFLTELYNMLSDENDKHEFIKVAFSANNIKFIFSSINNKDILLNEIFDGSLTISFNNVNKTQISYFGALINPVYFVRLLDSESNRFRLIDYRFSNMREEAKKNQESFREEGNFDEEIYDLSTILCNKIENTSTNWKTSITPWDEVVEKSRGLFGDKIAISMISIIASGVKSKSERYDGFEELFNSNLSLCKRARCARLKSGNITFWRDKIEEVNEENIIFLILIIFTWSTPRVFDGLHQLIDNTLNNISIKDYNKIYSNFSKISRLSRFSSSNKKTIESLINDKQISTRFSLLLYLRFLDDEKHDTFIENIQISDYQNLPIPVVNRKVIISVEKFLTKPDDSTLLFEIKEIYRATKFINKYALRRMSHLPRSREIIPTKMPYSVAKDIVANSKEYPRVISTIAEKTCRSIAFQNINHVGTIAENEGWFEN